MAAVFLVTLYEYSPLFYITVVFVCFLVTSGLVLAWSGLGVPVILRNSEETESSARVLKKQMRQVKNPFGLEILHPATASVTMEIEFKYLFGSEFEVVPDIPEMSHIRSEIHALLHHWEVVSKADLHWHLLPSQMWSLPMNKKRAAAVLPLCLHKKNLTKPQSPKQETEQLSVQGITLTPDCLEDCILTCYWGCSVQKLHEALQKHVYCFRIKTPQALEDALYSEYLYRQQYFIKKNDKEEKHCQLPEDAQVVDFGPVPRSRYPLVALLTLADEEDREIYDIISMVAVIHIPDESYRLPCRILYQYLLLAQGQYHELKQLFMSANSTAASSSDTSPGERSADRSLLERAGLAEDEPELHEENSKDCVVCQNGTVNWVLLPCRHTCLCDGCIKYFQQCPMCRQFVQESFPLCSETEQDEDESTCILQDLLPRRVF